MPVTQAWQPFREPLRATLMRTVPMAVAIGAAIAWGLGGIRYWPLGALLALWVTLGGHLVEVLFLNGVRPRLARTRAVQVIARLAVWFLGGVGLGACMKLTAGLFDVRTGQWPAWWAAGAAFVVIELIVHLGALIRGKPSFYGGMG